MRRFLLLLLASSLLLVACNDDSSDLTSSNGASNMATGEGGSSGGESSGGSSNCSSCSYYRTQISNASSDLKTEQDRLARYKSNGTGSSTIQSQTKLVQSKESYLSSLQSKASSCGC